MRCSHAQVGHRKCIRGARRSRRRKEVSAARVLRRLFESEQVYVVSTSQTLHDFERDEHLPIHRGPNLLHKLDLRSAATHERCPAPIPSDQISSRLSQADLGFRSWPLRRPHAIGCSKSPRGREKDKMKRQEWLASAR